MVAYSFKKRFAPHILTGRKKQTIRAERKRHARPGEELQLYTGMRTRSCRLLGRARCKDVIRVKLHFVQNWVSLKVTADGSVRLQARKQLDTFARCDGFDDWDDMKAFWRSEHGDLDQFTGVLISWHEIAPADPVMP